MQFLLIANCKPEQKTYVAYCCMFIWATVSAGAAKNKPRNIMKTGELKCPAKPPDFSG